MKLKHSLLWAVASLAFSAATAVAADYAYIRGDSAPWDSTTNEAEMDQAFGAGNWDDLRMTGGAGPFLPAAGYKAIFLEGSNKSANELDAYLSANRPNIEAFVRGGGCLFLNSAPNEGGDIDFGFGGVTLKYENASITGAANVIASDPAHPIFAGPATPVGTAFSGNWFSHAFIVGADVTPLIIAAPGEPVEGETVLGEMVFGSGMVLFGGLTTTKFHTPLPEASNLRANILSHVGACQVTPPAPVEVTAVPTLNELGLMLLGLAAAGLGAAGLQRRRKPD